MYERMLVTMSDGDVLPLISLFPNSKKDETENQKCIAGPMEHQSNRDVESKLESCSIWIEILSRQRSIMVLAVPCPW